MRNYKNERKLNTMLTEKKRWVAIVAVPIHDWIKDTAKKTSLSGNDVVTAALERCMEDPAFFASLAETQLKIKLQELNDREAVIEAEREALKTQFKASAGKERIKVPS